MEEFSKKQLLDRVQGIALLGDEDKSILFDLGMSYIRPGGIAIEIGSWKGGSAIILGTICQHRGARLYCVDCFSRDIHKFGEIEDTERLLAFVANTAGLPVSIITGDSAVVHRVLKDGCADLVNIDGDHHYDMVKSDLLNFGPKLRDGGVICGHDYNKGTVDVMTAVDEVIGKKRLNSVASTFFTTDLTWLGYTAGCET